MRREAYFSNPAEITNIFSRVTGNNPSTLLGKLGVLGNANLFFINPNGIIFGKNARLDIKASFVASTASNIIFSDNNLFSASNPQIPPPLLTVNVPTPVGLEFEGEPGKITNRSQFINQDSRELIGTKDGARVGSFTFAKGNAGNLTVKASESVKLEGVVVVAGIEYPSGLFTVVEEGSSGNAGNILINTGKLTVEEGSFISVDTSGTGKAGELTLNVNELIIRNGGRVTASSSGNNIGGDIELTAGNLNLNNGKISAETRSNTGGDITLNTQNLLQLRNNSQISTTAGNEQFGGDGGNININTPDGFIVAFPNEDSNISANAFEGNGGKIDISAFGIFGIEFRDKPTSLSDITASSQLGFDGNVDIETPGIEPNPETVELAQDVQSVEVAQGCQVSGETAVAFFNIGRGGLPPSPGETLNSEDVIAGWIPLVMEEERNSQVDKKDSRIANKKIATSDCKND